MNAGSTVSGFHTMQVISWLFKDLLSYQKGLCSVELVKIQNARCTKKQVKIAHDKPNKIIRLGRSWMTK